MDSHSPASAWPGGNLDAGSGDIVAGFTFQAQ